MKKRTNDKKHGLTEELKTATRRPLLKNDWLEGSLDPAFDIFYLKVNLIFSNYQEWIETLMHKTKR